ALGVTAGCLRATAIVCEAPGATCRSPTTREPEEPVPSGMLRSSVRAGRAKRWMVVPESAATYRYWPSAEARRTFGSVPVAVARMNEPSAGVTLVQELVCAAAVDPSVTYSVPAFGSHKTSVAPIW